MKTYRITELASACGLSRSTLLHYDRIGLLSASDRSRADYRLYTDADRRRLESICQYRSAGLPLADIRALLDAPGRTSVRLLEKRLRQTSEEIGTLRIQQRVLASLLRMAGGKAPPAVDKDMWISMLQAAGVSSESMDCWHAEFERRAPREHHGFLASLGLSESEIARIRSDCAAPKPCSSRRYSRR